MQSLFPGYSHVVTFASFCIQQVSEGILNWVNCIKDDSFVNEKCVVVT